MDIARNARKHGVSHPDMIHAARHAFLADRSGQLLEVVVLHPDDDDAIFIHAMPLRPSFYRYL